MNAKTLSRKGIGIIAVAAAAAAGPVLAAAPASADLYRVIMACGGDPDIKCGTDASILIAATSPEPVAVVVNGVTLGGSPFTLSPTCSYTTQATYGAMILIQHVYGDQHIVATQKKADGTISQQTFDFDYAATHAGSSGSSLTGLLGGSLTGSAGGSTGSSTLNSLYTQLNGFQTGSSGGQPRKC